MNFLAKLNFMISVLVHLRVNCLPPVVLDACESNQFQCNDGQCIQKEYLCDGDKNCRDESDEGDEICGKTHPTFECEKGRQYIPLGWRCDGDKDCKDDSDELNCDWTTTTEAIKTVLPKKNPKESCPINYCHPNAECVVHEGQYYCNCPSSFEGEDCMMNFTAGNKYSNHCVVIYQSLSLLFLCMVIFFICINRY